MLLREGRIGKLILKHRMLTGPMERGMANRDGSLNQRTIDYLVEFGERPRPRVPPELADPLDALEVGEHEDVEQPGTGSLPEGVQALP